MAIQTVLRGAIPTAISKEGFTWRQELTKESKETIAILQEQVRGVEEDLTALTEQVALGREKPS